MIRGKKVGISILALGLVLIIVALVIKLAIVPGMKKWPGNVDETRYYEGTLNTMLNADALSSGDLANIFVRDVPVFTSRHYTVEETSGDKMLVREVINIEGPDGKSIISSDKLWPLHRKDLNIIPNFTDYESVQQGEGLVISFPIGTDKEDQTVWFSEFQAAAPIKYLREEHHEGIRTYVFEATVSGSEITDPVLLASLPQSLSKSMFTMLIQSVPLTPEAETALAHFDLSALPDPVPLKYIYQDSGTYWIEPTLGINVDIDRTQTHMVALQTVNGLIPLTPVFDIEYSQADESVAYAVTDARDKKDDLNLYGSTIPYILIVAGAVLSVVSLVLLWRHQRTI